MSLASLPCCSAGSAGGLVHPWCGCMWCMCFRWLEATGGGRAADVGGQQESEAGGVGHDPGVLAAAVDGVVMCVLESVWISISMARSKWSQSRSMCWCMARLCVQWSVLTPRCSIGGAVLLQSARAETIGKGKGKEGTSTRRMGIADGNGMEARRMHGCTQEV